MVLSNLTTNGAKTVLFTGDIDRVAYDVSDRLMLSSYKASLLHEDKIIAIQEMMDSKKNNDVICCVGDGVNELDVIIVADLSIALGGIDKSMDADIIVLGHNLNTIQNAVQLAKKTMSLTYFLLYLLLF